MQNSNNASKTSSCINDQATKHDKLGFDLYVKAFFGFLTDQNTKPPLTVSIEGEWGCGKSSFILQLEDDIKKAGGKTVIFNAWRHDKAEALWAAFILDFINQLSQQKFWIKRLLGNFKLLYLRFNWRAGAYAIRIVIFTFTLLLSAYLLKDFILIRDTSNIIHDISIQDISDIIHDTSKLKIIFGGIVASLGTIISFNGHINKIFQNPFEMDLKKCLESPDYTNYVAFIEKFHTDFSKVIDAYSKNSKVYIFIDDLDRCEISTAAELMQAINLLVANDPNLIFIIGMDRMKVASGIAAKNEDLLPYLYSSNSSNNCTFNGDSNLFGLKYGYEFMEKFIQIPFSIPMPDERSIQNYIKEILPQEPQNKQSTNLNTLLKQKINKYRSKIKRIYNSQEKSNRNLDNKKNIKTRKLYGYKRSEDITEITLMVSSALGKNPRRIKQFINLFMLKSYIAEETGLFYDHAELPIDKMWTPEKLAKFVAISIRWPMLMNDLYFEKNLLHNLQIIALDPLQREKMNGNSKIIFWSKQQELMDFLTKGCYNSDGKSINHENLKIYALNNLNYDKLIDVSPINTLPIVHLSSNYEGINRYDEHIVKSELDTDMENTLESVHVNLRNFKHWFLDILDIDLYFKNGTESQYEPSENPNFPTILEEHISFDDDPYIYDGLKKEEHAFKVHIASLLEKDGYGKIDLNIIDYEIVEFIEPND